MRSDEKGRGAYKPFPISQETIAIDVADSPEKFAVRRIYCVARNYSEHVKELGQAAVANPLFFQKPRDAIVTDGAIVPYPSCTSDFQHEVELILAINQRGKDVPAENAGKCIFGLAVGIDFTRRDLQKAARDIGGPWESSKAFDFSAAVGSITPLRSEMPANQAMRLSVNGDLRQRGDTRDMIMKPDQIVAHLSGLFTLYPGDLIFTGTPSGVSALHPGDVIDAVIDGLQPLHVTIGEPEAL